MTTAISATRVNSRITAPELRVIGADGENFGVLSRDEALEKARKAGLDLIEIAPNAKPPVARVMSFDKYRYQKEKEERKERKAQRGSGLKQVQISVRAAPNDLQIKLKRLEEFLAEGHPVEIRLRLRGREKGNKDWARKKLDEFLAMIQTEHKIANPPKWGGMGLAVQIVRK